MNCRAMGRFVLGLEALSGMKNGPLANCCVGSSSAKQTCIFLESDHLLRDQELLCKNTTKEDGALMSEANEKERV